MPMGEIEQAEQAWSALARVPLDRPAAIGWHLDLSSVDTSGWQSFTVFVRCGDQRFERPLAALHRLLVGVAVSDRRATDDAAAPFRQHYEKSMIFIGPFDDH